MAIFDSKQYWEQRLSEDYSLTGVGLRRLGPSFNEWAYRLRRDRFLTVVGDCDLNLPECRVLDIGSGTGFYIQRWQELGVRHIVGSDLADAAVTRLRSAFLAVRFVQLDIGDPLPADLPAGSFDIVDAMDVLFHIMDDDRFVHAIQNIHRLLRPDGLFIWSDGFIHTRPVRKEHIVMRTLGQIEPVLQQTGFEVLTRVPMFQLMNAPVDARHRIATLGWLAAAWLVSLHDSLGNLAGKALYRLETHLAQTRTESPTIEIMVCRKQGLAPCTGQPDGRRTELGRMRNRHGQDPSLGQRPGRRAVDRSHDLLNMIKRGCWK